MTLTPLTLIVIGLIVIICSAIIIINNASARAGGLAYLIPVSVLLLGVVVFLMGLH